MHPIAQPPTQDVPAATAPGVPRHLLRSIRTLNALYDELNQIVEQARSPRSTPER